MSTKTVQTPYGDTTIEVVECDSCGAEVAKDDALEFTLGDRTGWACEHCYETGPIGFPEKVIEWAMPKDPKGASMWEYVGLFPVYCWLMLRDGFLSKDKFANGYTAGVMGSLLWLAICIVYMVV